MAEHATQTVTQQNRQRAVKVDRSSESAKRLTVRPENEMHEWQSTLGNQGMQRSLLAGGSGIPILQRKCAACAKEEETLNSGVIQTKLAINKPGDVFEQEADRVADAVMRVPRKEAVEWAGGSSSTTLPRVQRMCQECEQELQTEPNKLEGMNSNVSEQSNADPEPDDNLQAKEIPGATPKVTSTASAEITALKGGGKALPKTDQRFFESRFGYDFSGVRVFTDDRAAQSARQIQALAYTTGSNIVFGTGQYHPETSSGRWLIAHELTHVVQQGGRDMGPPTSSQQSWKPQFGRGPSGIQRMGDPTQAPKSLACPIANTSSAFPVDTNVLFGLESASLTPKATADIADFAARWNAAGAKQLVRIDGFASTDGPQSLNWTLSCQRAQTVGSELENPSGGGKGVAANFIDVFAQGETGEFSRTLELNRRATISADLSVPPPPPCANPGVTRDLDVQPVFLRTGPADPSPTGTSWARRFNEANAIWGKLGVTFHDLGSVTLDTPLKTAGATRPERDAIRALRSGSGVEVFLVDNDLASVGGGATIAGCDANGKIALSDRGNSDTLLAHELGHTLGLNHPGDPGNPGEANTIMDASNSNSTPNPTRNTMQNFNKILCPPGSASTCLNPDP